MIAYCTKGKEELEKTGAIIMLHSGLAEGTLYELEALQLALFIGLLVVHERF